MNVEVPLNSWLTSWSDRCTTCFTLNRNLKPLKDKTLLEAICAGSQFSKFNLICWECEAMLENIKRFRSKVVSAQSLRNQVARGIYTRTNGLTKLKTTDIEILSITPCIEEIPIETDNIPKPKSINTEIDIPIYSEIKIEEEFDENNIDENNIDENNSDEPDVPADDDSADAGSETESVIDNDNDQALRSIKYENYTDNDLHLEEAQLSYPTTKLTKENEGNLECLKDMCKVKYEDLTDIKSEHEILKDLNAGKDYTVHIETNITNVGQTSEQDSVSFMFNGNKITFRDETENRETVYFNDDTQILSFKEESILEDSENCNEEELEINDRTEPVTRKEESEILKEQSETLIPDDDEMCLEDCALHDKKKRPKQKRIYKKKVIKYDYECEICFKPFKEKKLCEEHEKTHEDQVGKLTCSMCPERFFSTKQKQKHQQTIHSMSRFKITKEPKTRSQVIPTAPPPVSKPLSEPEPPVVNTLLMINNPMLFLQNIQPM